MTPDQFLDTVRTYCHRFNASITSYYRTPLHNTHVGGVRYSAHQVWLAVDVVYDDGTNLNGADEWASALGLEILHEPDHDHIQPKNWASRFPSRETPP